MLVPAMTRNEITRMVNRDYEIITNSSTLGRFYQAYYHERTSRKIRRRKITPDPGSTGTVRQYYI